MHFLAGSSTPVRWRDVVAVIDLDGKITTSDTADFLRRAEKDGIVELAGEDLPKCFILAVPQKRSRRPLKRVRRRVILSHLSTAALGGRAAVSLI